MERTSDTNREQNPILSQKSHMKYIRSHILLRVLASLSTFVAALLMALNKQSTDFAGVRISASYKSSPAFEFFVIGNAIVCGYSLISLPFVFNTMVVSYSLPLLDLACASYSLPLLDLVSLGLVMASATAATAIAYLGKRGNSDIGWFMVCPYVDKFCDRVGISLIFSFLGFLLFLLICSLSSVYKTRLINAQT